MKDQNPWKKVFEQNPELTEKQGRDLRSEISNALENRLEAELGKDWLRMQDDPLYWPDINEKCWYKTKDGDIAVICKQYNMVTISGYLMPMPMIVNWPNGNDMYVGDPARLRKYWPRYNVK